MKRRRLLTIRSSILLMVFMAQFVSFGVYADKISLSLRNASMSQLFLNLEKNSDYAFIYNENMFAGVKKTDYLFENLGLLDILDNVLQNSNVTYKILDNHVILTKKPEGRLQEESKTVVVTGKVVDETGEAMPGAYVMIKGTKLGISTNTEGTFKLVLPEMASYKLVISFVGMGTQEVTWEGKEVKVILQEEINAMEEVIITGYQTIERRKSTAAITSVKASDILIPGMTSIDQALEGQIPELLMINNSGEVGATGRIRVRGTSTLMGKREPLWVLDGFILEDPVEVDTDDLNDPDYINIIGNAIAGINPQDIERIDVLMDAAATALYGTQAANGVIVVTTKRGTIGRPSVSYNHTSKFTLRPRYSNKDVNLMNSQERVEFGRDLINTHYVFDANMPLIGYEGTLIRYYQGLISYEQFIEETKRYETINTDWFSLLTRDTYSHDHTLSVSGGNEALRYYSSLGYGSENGVSRTTYSDRYSFRTNLETIMSEKIQMNLSVSGNITKRNNLMDGLDVMDYAYNTTRALPAYEDNGDLFYYDKIGYNAMNTRNYFRYNILNEMQNSENTYDGNSINASINLRYRVLPTLSVTVAGNYSRSATLQEKWWGEKSHYITRLRNAEYEDVPYSGEDGHCILPYGGILKTANTYTESKTGRIQYDWTKHIGINDQHQFASSGGFEANSSSSNAMTEEHRGYIKERGMKFIDNVDLEKYPLYQEWLNTNARRIDRGLSNKLSGYITLSYSYYNHFTVSTNARLDASNNFGSKSNERMLPVMTVSGNWNLKENIFKNLNFISSSSFRGSFGAQGNMNKSQSPNVVISQGVKDPLYNENISPIVRYPNPNLKWEETRQTSLGMDLALFKDRIRISGSYYYKFSKDCFTTVTVSSVNGVPGHTYVMNGGDLENKGYSVSLSTQPIVNHNFTWRFSTYFAANHNKVKQGKSQEKYDFRSYLNGNAIVKGEAISSFYSYKFIGLNPNDGAPMFDDYQDKQHLLRGKSLEETVKMTMEKSGQRDPIFNGSFNTSLTYRSCLTLSASFTYNLGSKIRLFALYQPIIKGLSAENNVRKEFLNRWQMQGDEKRTSIPAIISPSNDMYSYYDSHYSANGGKMDIKTFGQSYWEMYDNSNLRVVSGNYLKCSSMSLRYSIPSKLLRNMPFNSLSMSLNAMNIFTIASKELDGQSPLQAGFAKPNLSLRPSYTFQFNVSF